MALPRFPLIVHHKPDEPSYGLLTRTAVHNGTRLYPAIFARYGIKYRFGVHNIDPVEVAFSCHADPIGVVRASPVAATKTVELLHQVLHRDHFSTVRRRWCPECLKEDAYHRAWWDIVAITCCPKHGIETPTSVAVRHERPGTHLGPPTASRVMICGWCRSAR